MKNTDYREIYRVVKRTINSVPFLYETNCFITMGYGIHICAVGGWWHSLSKFNTKPIYTNTTKYR